MPELATKSLQGGEELQKRLKRMALAGLEFAKSNLQTRLELFKSNAAESVLTRLAQENHEKGIEEAQYELIAAQELCDELERVSLSFNASQVEMKEEALSTSGIEESSQELNGEAVNEPKNVASGVSSHRNSIPQETSSVASSLSSHRNSFQHEALTSETSSESGSLSGSATLGYDAVFFKLMLKAIAPFNEGSASELRVFFKSVIQLFEHHPDLKSTQRLIIIRGLLGAKSINRFDNWRDGGDRTFEDWKVWFYNNRVIDDDSRNAERELIRKVQGSLSCVEFLAELLEIDRRIMAHGRQSLNLENALTANCDPSIRQSVRSTVYIRKSQLKLGLQDALPFEVLEEIFLFHEISRKQEKSGRVHAVQATDGSKGPRQERRHCYHCGETGHIRPNCPKRQIDGKVSLSQVDQESDSDSSHNKALSDYPTSRRSQTGRSVQFCLQDTVHEFHSDSPNTKVDDTENSVLVGDVVDPRYADFVAEDLENIDESDLESETASIAEDQHQTWNDGILDSFEATVDPFNDTVDSFEATGDPFNDTVDSFDATVVDSEPVVARSDSRMVFTVKGNGVRLQALVDTGATVNGISRKVAELHKFPILKGAVLNVTFADGRPVACSDYVEVVIQVHKYYRKIRFAVLDIVEDLILGVPWLETIVIHKLHWEQQVLIFANTGNSKIKYRWWGVQHPVYGANMIIRSCSVNNIDFVRDTCYVVNIAKEKDSTFDDLLASTDPRISAVLAEFQDVFTPISHVSELPQRPEDQKIHLKPGSQIPTSRLRRFSEVEDEALKKFLKQYIETGRIEVSNSSFGANVLFVRKADGTLRLCVDWRQLNAITVKDSTPLSPCAEVREHVQGKPILSSVDVSEAFFSLLLDPEDRHKTAFKTRFGLFQFTVSPMGLTNSPAAFLRLMNRIFKDMVDISVSFYMDDILIYTDTIEEHVVCVREVLSRLRANKLSLKASKCVFAVAEVVFCGMVISGDGVKISNDQVQMMLDYPQIDSKNQLMRFLGSVRFFSEFIPWIGHLASPLFDLTAKGVAWDWNCNHQSLLRVLQFYMTTAPCLRFFESGRKTSVFTDASSFAIGGWLGQEHVVDGKVMMCPVVYWSKKLTPAERRYPVHDLELLALQSFVLRFRMYLYGQPFEAIVDHKSLLHLFSQPLLSDRQIRTIEKLLPFNFTIRYLPGPRNFFADLCSRHPHYANASCPRCDFDLNQGDDTQEHDDLMDGTIQSLSEFTIAENFVKRIRDGQVDDSFCSQLESWSRDRKSIPNSRHGFFKSFTKVNGIWRYRNRALVVPGDELQQYFLDFFHEQGHFGLFKMRDLMLQYVYWPELVEDIRSFVRSCHECQLTKPGSTAPMGLLKHLEVPDSRCKAIAMDFAVMPRSRQGHDYLLIVTDRLTKFTVAVPTRRSLNAKGLAELIFENWFLRGFGFPGSVVCDRDKLFVSEFFKEFCMLAGIRVDMATARHQNTDGQSEAAVKIVKDALRRVCNHAQTDWDTKLALILFAINNSIHSATGFRPFYLMFAFEPSVFPNFFSRSNKSMFAEFIRYKDNLVQAHDNIAKSHDRQRLDYDKRRSLEKEFSVGDLVLLRRDGVESATTVDTPNCLLPLYLGPFRILEIDVDRQNYTLDLPHTMRCHRVFHVRCLKRYYTPSEFLSSRVVFDEPDPVQVEDGGLEFEVEEIRHTRWFRRKRQFLIRWKGYSSAADSWEYADCLVNCLEKLQEFLEGRNDRDDLIAELAQSNPELGLGGML